MHKLGFKKRKHQPAPPQRKHTWHSLTVIQTSSDTSSVHDHMEHIRSRAAANDVKAVSTSLQEDASRLELTDAKGWTVLHYAVAAGSMDVLAVLAQYQPDWSAVVDDFSNALHIAVDKDLPEVCRLLLDHDCDFDWTNGEKLTPIHQAIKYGRNNCLKAMLDTNKINNATCKIELGLTPIHYAAVTNNREAAQCLLDHGAYLCTRCDMGNTAIHYAAKHASKDVLDLLLSVVEMKGYTRDYLLSIQDKYGQSPLHAAINSGNTEAVRVCLEAGANINTKQEDGSTAIHLVCSQGELKIVKLMFEIQPDKKNSCLHMKDKSGMTPLHRAAMFDYVELVNYLLSEGAPLEERDCHGRTPLLLAASRQNSRTTNALIAAGANYCSKDNEMSNFLHLAIKGGGNMIDIPNIEERGGDLDQCEEMLNQKDIAGCTPLHYASKYGNLSSIARLLTYGARVTCKDNTEHTSLHFAAEYGRYNSCVTLLDTMQGSYVINEANRDGKTALHLAAQNGHVKVVALLMQRGALLHRDYKGNSPLHLTVAQSYTQTMKLLLNVHPSLLNAPNSEGNTPLHEAAIANKPKAISLLLTLGAQVYENNEERSFLDLATERGNMEAAMAVINHDRWSEILSMRSKIHHSYMEALIRYLPDACMAALDHCVEHSEHDPNSVEYCVTYSFELIDDEWMTLDDQKGRRNALKRLDRILPLRPASSVGSVRSTHDENAKLLDAGGEPPIEKRKRLEVLLSMVKYERVRCLSHPVCLQYLKMKWSSYGMWIHMLNLLLYCCVLGLFTYQMMTFPGHPKKAITPVVSVLANGTTPTLNETDNITTPEAGKQWYANGVAHLVINILIVLFIIFNMIKEVAQLIQLRWRYFMDFVNIIEWTMYISAALYIVPLLFNVTNEGWSWQCGHIALFLAWVNLLLFLQRFEFFGIYVVMFQEILKTLIQVIVVFAVLFLAFGFTFYSLLKNQDDNGFREMGISFMTSVLMMIGDINYLDTFVNGDKPYPVLTFLLLVTFILLMPILLINLMIGLAVGDIASVQQNARLKRLAMQVEFLSDMEAKLPAFILNKFNKQRIVKHPNHCSESIGNWYVNLISSAEAEPQPESDVVSDSLKQQKNRLKELQHEVRGVTELLKLVVQKMEIRTESDGIDEGVQDENQGISLILKKAAAGNTTTACWKKKVDSLAKEAGVLRTWNRMYNTSSQKSITERETQDVPPGDDTPATVTNNQPKTPEPSRNMTSDTMTRQLSSLDEERTLTPVEGPDISDYLNDL